MKGLLWKDFYVFIKNCRLFLLVVIGFIFISAFNDETFYILYPCLFAGMIPVTLMAYDEQSKWNQYCSTLPCSKTQMVSEKYLVVLLSQAATLLLSCIVQTAKIIGGSGQMDLYLSQMATGLLASFVLPSFVLPFMFKMGVEKGRIVYIFLLAAVGALSYGVIELIKIPAAGPGLLSSSFPLPLLCLAAIAIYALSWLLSVSIYKKKEDI